MRNQRQREKRSSGYACYLPHAQLIPMSGVMPLIVAPANHLLTVHLENMNVVLSILKSLLPVKISDDASRITNWPQTSIRCKSIAF
jgi:hypothetical protein